MRNTIAWALMCTIPLYCQAKASDVMPEPIIERATKLVLGPDCTVTRKPSMRTSMGTVYTVATTQWEQYIAIEKDGISETEASRLQQLIDEYAAANPGATIPDVQLPLAYVVREESRDGMERTIGPMTPKEFEEFDWPGQWDGTQYTHIEFQKRAPGKDMRRTKKDILAGKMLEMGPLK